jgi:hypothetical protein
MTARASTHDGTGRELDLRRLLVAAGAVVLPGFVALALLGSLRRYQPGLPGFWDYPSGTIGDAFLVPTMIAGMVVQAHALRDSRTSKELRWQLIGGSIGAVGGLAVPLSWYLDPHTRHIWMLPGAHHYLLAGWWHLTYLTAATGALGLLLGTVLCRLRKARQSPATGLPVGYLPSVMTFVVGAGLGMLVLIGRDAIAGGNSAASTVTVGALAGAALAFLGGLKWAVRGIHWRRLQMPCLIVGTFLLGLVGVIVRWPPHDTAIIGVGALSAALACIAATSSLTSHPERSAHRWSTAVAMSTVATAGLIRSSDAFLRGDGKSLVWLAGGVVVASCVLVIVQRGALQPGRTLRYALFSVTACCCTTWRSLYAHPPATIALAPRLVLPTRHST